MVDEKSLDEFNVIAAMLRDANASHGVVFNTIALTKTLKKVKSRMRFEGLGFLTKTLAHLGRSFDKALTGECRLTAKEVGFKPCSDSELPRFLGEFFSTIFSSDGQVLRNPDAKSVEIVRQLIQPFGKYKLPHSDEQEHSVISAFCNAEKDLTDLDKDFALLQNLVDSDHTDSYGTRPFSKELEYFRDSGRVLFRSTNYVIRDARRALKRLFLQFDPTDINPRHGPGAVAQKQQRSGKFQWTNVSNRITSVYPFDAYFCASSGHVCDTFDTFSRVEDKDLPARVLLVPKDSRGPRLISCEPVDFQWIQQGLGSAIVRHVESHALTRGHVNFTDQQVNREMALKGSISGDFATLDLKEASDRVHVDLVRLLFPDSLFGYLKNCRSLSTVLPSGQELTLKKFAPMGSALCFPILALTIWAILRAGTADASVRKNIYVYGDDVIVPSAYAHSAMAVLEAFGLKINHAKSCCSGLFRESCGMDAFKGVNVTPVRFRTVWNKSPSPNTYCSWIAYANSFYDKGWMSTYGVICEMLESVFGPIPGEDLKISCPSLRTSPHTDSSFRKRWNPKLQRIEFYVRSVESRSHTENYPGWNKLLRYFSEKPNLSKVTTRSDPRPRKGSDDYSLVPFSVGLYTKRRSSKLVRRWR
jgi:hypothetical protein